jgi:serine/threonine protein phosphatase PrpC
MATTADVKVGEHGQMEPTNNGLGINTIKPHKCEKEKFTCCMFQHIGDRKTQEDRFVVAPELTLGTAKPSHRQSFFGVFDGTVGDLASETAKCIALKKLAGLDSWKALQVRSPSTYTKREIETMTVDLYKAIDKDVLEVSASNQKNYTTCTGVTAMILGELLVIGHVGDSRCYLGKEDGAGTLSGEQLTFDHKPELTTEKERIEKCGGMVERLLNHNNKPFHRGGDFLMRKALGETPMQLQYSRAFGAKDLKCFGSICVPDVKIIKLDPSMKVVVLASDGLWDVVQGNEAVTRAMHAIKENANPAEKLIAFALEENAKKGTRADNITCVCIIFH